MSKVSQKLEGFPFHALFVLVATVSIGGALIALFSPQPSRFGGADVYAGMLLTPIILIFLAPLTVTLHRSQFRAGSSLISIIFVLLWAVILLAVYTETWFWIDRTKLWRSIAVLSYMGIPTAVAL